MVWGERVLKDYLVPTALLWAGTPLLLDSVSVD